MKHAGGAMSMRVVKLYLVAMREALIAEQERLLVGFVFWKNVNNEIVQLRTCITFLEESFGITMVESSMHDYLTSHGFSSRKMKNSFIKRLQFII